MAYRIHSSLAIVVSVWTGPITNEEIVSSYERLHADPAFRTELDQLADLRAADLSEVTSEGLRALARRAERHAGPNKSAVLAPGDLTFGMGRMYEVLTESARQTVRVFRDAGEALRWLGAPEDLLDAPD